ncbi:DegT/DnrJ/EryC1/StrS family aminotransferase [Pelagibacteraceae bacterium]|jgi:perosamine synthetase|nr:DegT/DnrJ/EryC1/StrS family aminotransferase [Pelagibacteraceae bacterium]
MIPWARPDFYGYEEKYVKQALKSTWISDGQYVREFERKFSKYLNLKHSISVSNGTCAIHLAFLSMGLKKGDEIIVPGFGYMAAANIALQMNLKPVFADVDPETYCVTAESIKNQITKKTKLVVITHTYGNVCDLTAIIQLLKKRKITLLEDTAESFGSTYKKKQSGTFGDIATFSFQATKTITTGEGGMIVTKKGNNFINKIRSLRSHGVIKKRYYHVYAGHNFRLTNVQAAIGCAQLKRFSIIKKERNRIHKQYKKLFNNIEGIKIQLFKENVSPVVWTFAFSINEKIFPKRDKIIDILQKKKIETRNAFYSPCRLPLYKKYKTSHLKNSNFLSRNVICMPFYASLKNNQIEHIYNQFIKLKK